MTDRKLTRPLGISLGILIAVMGILSGASLVKSIVARFVFQPTPFQPAIVSDLSVSHSPDWLLPEQEVMIWVNVDVANPEIPIDFRWSIKGGEIRRGQGTAKITYKAPDTPGTYKVSLKVKYGDWYTERAKLLFVVSPTPSPTSTSTDTPTPTNTPTPADTPTPTLTPTGTPPPTDTPTPIPDAVVNAEALNLRSGPGIVYDILAVLKQGDSLKVRGRNLVGDWLKVIAPDGKEGWVAASLLEINLSLAGVAVAQVPPTPTPMHTPTPAVTPTPTLLPPPILLEPETGAAFLGEPPPLKWQWDRPRAPNEVFAVRVRREGETRLCHHDKADKPEYKASLSYCTAGTHYWSIALIRDIAPWLPENDLNRWETLSETSAERWFYYVPAEEPWTWPTPPGDDDDDGDAKEPPEP